jgi:hypothetical protein
MGFAPIARVGLVVMFTLSAMGQDAPPPGVAGTWEHKGVAGETITFILNPDGSAKIDDDAAKYTVAGNTISVVIDGETIRYTFKLEGDAMTVSGGDLDKPTTFTRKGTPPAPKRGLGAKIKTAGDEKKTSPFDVAGALSGDAKPANTPAAAPTLIGKWQAEDGSELSFTEDHFKFGGRDVPYKAADGKITLTGPNGQIQWPYELTADQLTLTLEGNKQILKRVGATPVAVAGAGAADQKPAPVTAATPIGTWAAADGDKIEIRDNAVVYQGTAIAAKDTGSAIRVSFQGQTMDWPYELNGDSMKLTIGGQALALKRVGAAPVVEPKKGADAGAAAAGPAPANADPKSIVGAWDGPDGTVTVRADGTARTGGQDFKWSADASTITLSDDKNWVKIPYKLEGDKLVLGTGPSKTLTRNKGGLAGVWVAQESTLDPQFFQSVTQYVSLFPDGSVGFAKSEGGATRTAVTEHLERFSSFKANQGGGTKTYGRWQQDGDTVTIQWQGAFGNATWQGRVNPQNGKLVIPRAGILKEGDTLEYERQ